MIPPNGSITIIGNSGTLTATDLTHNLTGTVINGSNLLIVTATPNVALDAIRTSAGLFIMHSTNLNPGTRVIAQRSPISYAIATASWASGTQTITAAIPAAASAGVKLHFENTQNPALSTTFTTSGATYSSGTGTATFTFALATDPGTGFTGGRVFIGILDAVAGTGSNATGYYTLSRPAIVTVNTNTVATTHRVPSQVPTGTTHVIAASGAAQFASITIDGVGTPLIPCGQLLALTNLKGGSYFMAAGTTSGTHVISLAYATLNPFANP